MADPCLNLSSLPSFRCEDIYNCCDCGGHDCGCAYCWSCKACEACTADN